MSKQSAFLCQRYSWSDWLIDWVSEFGFTLLTRWAYFAPKPVESFVHGEHCECLNWEQNPNGELYNACEVVHLNKYRCVLLFSEQNVYVHLNKKQCCWS